MSTLSIFEVRSGYVERFGWVSAEVIAPDLPSALQAGTDTDPWLWQDAREVTVKRTGAVYCEHECATSRDREGNVWECDDCRATWVDGAEYPEPTLTARAFALYCERLAESGYPYAPTFDDDLIDA